MQVGGIQQVCVGRAQRQSVRQKEKARKGGPSVDADVCAHLNSIAVAVDQGGHGAAANIHCTSARLQ